MQYRLVYDVLIEGSPWGVFWSIGMLIASTAILLALAMFLEIVERVQGRPRVPVPYVPGRANIEAAPLPFVIVSGLLLAAAGVFVFSHIWQAFVDQQRYQEWVRTGAYQVSEGAVADFEFRKAGPRFRVGDLTFDCIDNAAGFRGRFNAPGTANRSLREGLSVRLCHRGGIILRIEIGRSTARPAPS